MTAYSKMSQERRNRLIGGVVYIHIILALSNNLFYHQSQTRVSIRQHKISSDDYIAVIYRQQYPTYNSLKQGVSRRVSHQKKFQFVVGGV